MYLGTPGRMVEIKCPTAQQVSYAQRYAVSTTLAGVVKAQAGPRARRTWDVNLGKLTTPADVSALVSFADGSWGPGPFWFIPADAPVVNLLTPAAASCAPEAITVAAGGQLLGSPPMNLGSDGIAARSVWKTPDHSAAIGGLVPVIPGRPVAVSAWVTGVGRLRVIFYDTAGQLVRTVESSDRGSSVPTRLSLTVITPANAAYLRFWAATGIEQLTRPAITWTDTPFDWGDGQGCDQAIVTTVDRNVTKAWDNPDTGRWSELAFTIQEIG